MQNSYDQTIHIGAREISFAAPTYFIADVASNHDGDLERAKALIWIARDAGADVAKFQHFKAEKIVSDRGFRTLGSQIAHQAAWQKSVYEIFKHYEFDREWNLTLAEEAKKAGIEFMTTPYDDAAVAGIDPLVNAYKIGSGDVTWPQFVAQVARRGKPMLIATGASDMTDVERCVTAVLAHNRQICLMQCNTNYTGSIENFRNVNLNVLRAFALHWPGMVLGLSDHTPGHSAVLGAVALGARVVEKHFTDDNARSGPDHPFSMNPASWREMVDRTRELEYALGDGVKRIEENESESVVVQRRCLRLVSDRPAGHRLTESDLEPLRPAPLGALEPWQMEMTIGRRLATDKQAGDAVYPGDLT